jgi:hypothetical protein
MKNMRKLIPAIAMLLVSAVMMSTASFAWFSIANTATAQGMQVKATAAGGFAIASYVTKDQAPSKDSFKTIANAAYKNGDATSLAPTSHATATDAWFKGSAAAVDNSAVNTDKYSAITGENGVGFYLHTKWQVMPLATIEGKGLAINKIELGTTGAGDVNTTSKLNEALRVAVKVGTNWFYFAPGRASSLDAALKHVETATTTTSYGTYAAGTNAAANANKMAFGQTYADPVIISNTLTAETPIDVEVYIYYEGEDPSCQTVYANNLYTTTIKIDFTAAAVVIGG